MLFPFPSFIKLTLFEYPFPETFNCILSSKIFIYTLPKIKHNSSKITFLLGKIVQKYYNFTFFLNKKVVFPYFPMLRLTTSKIKVSYFHIYWDISDPAHWPSLKKRGRKCYNGFCRKSEKGKGRKGD